MTVLRIQHTAPDFDRWKEAFDNDPLDREGSGVRRYRILRSTDDPKLVMVDLEFDDAAAADAMRSKLRELWNRVDVIGDDADARVADVIESTEY